MALSLALHGVAVILLFAAGASGSATSSEPALFVELAVTAEKAADSAEQAAPLAVQPAAPPPELSAIEASAAEPARPDAVIDPPPPEQPPLVELSELKAIELAPPHEPPPVRASDLKPVEKAKPEPPKPPPPASPPQVRSPPARVAANTAAGTAANAGARSLQAQSQSLGTGSAAQLAASGLLPAPTVVWEGRPRYRHPPTPAVYPSRAIELNQQGEALVRVRLDTEGGAVEILLHRSSGHALLDQAALAAVRGWRFLPAMRDSRPVPSWVEIPVRFHLR